MIPWAYIIPSFKMKRRRFMIKMVPEMTATIHEDALRVFGSNLLRTVCAPIWFPLAMGYIAFTTLSHWLEKLADLCYDGVGWFATVGQPRVPAMTDREDSEDISKEEFYKRVRAHRDRGGDVPSEFLNYMEKHKL